MHGIRHILLPLVIPLWLHEMLHLHWVHHFVAVLTISTYEHSTDVINKLTL